VGVETSRAVLGIQRRAWGVAADLVGSVGRLEVLGLDLRRSMAMEDAPEAAREAAELLRGEIQCVIADRLGPAIEALLDLQRPQAPEVRGETSE
jgi:hypothetical protein